MSEFKGKDIQYPFSSFDRLRYLFVDTPKVFTKEECEKIIKINEEKLEDSTITNPDDQGYDNYRLSKHTWVEYKEETEWIYQKMESIVREVNDRYFNFDLTGFEEPFQLTKYSNKGHYGLHMDAAADSFIPRKLTAVVQLSKSSDYKGGALDIICDGVKKETAGREQGSVFIFPSFMLHEVLPVTEGERYALVSWIGGPSFK